ncbi:MAG TPA: hypothetical protein VE129_00255 [Thermoanaerobaculia bacterium]|nr:hypothetical protein [Thermoanaerobaculia bacterium]
MSGTDYRWEDVVLAAFLWNEWAEVVERARLGLALSAGADETEAEDEDPLAEAVDAAAAEFRYARDLVTAVEMEAWLVRWGLDADSWMAWIQADLLRRTTPDAPAPVDEEVSLEVVSEAVFTEALCSGALDGFARRLAGHAAVFEKLREGDAKEADPNAASETAGLPADFPRLILEEGLPGLSPEATRERVDVVARLERAFLDFERSVVTPAAVEARVRARQVDWTRLSCRTLHLPREEMAREAVLSVREDGLSLDEVARDAKAAVEERTAFVDELPADIRDRLLAARKGELLGPLPWDDGFAVVLVLEKTLPSASDETVARRSREDLLATLVAREIDAKVTWRKAP